MTFTDFAVTLIQKTTRENDAVASVYTKTKGRLLLRFPGVKKTKAKLRSFCQPFAMSEMRMYFRPQAAIGCITGGKIVSVFADIRKNFIKSQLASHLCDIVFKLTPLTQPNEDKFNLLINALSELNDLPVSDAFRQSFTLRFMQTAGFGITNPPLDISESFWQKMHNENFGNIKINTPSEVENLNKTNYIINRFFIKYLGQIPHSLNLYNELTQSRHLQTV